MERAISRERSNSLPSLQASLAPLRRVAYKSELIAGYVRQQPYSDRMLEIDKAAEGSRNDYSVKVLDLDRVIIAGAFAALSISSMRSL